MSSFGFSDCRFTWERGETYSYSRSNYNAPRHKNLHFKPLGIGAELFGITTDVNVETGFLPFAKANMKGGARAVEAQLVTRTDYGSRIKFKDGEDVYLRQGTGKLLIGKLVDVPKYLDTKPAWKLHAPKGWSPKNG